MHTHMHVPQMYSHASRLPVWQLRTGRLVHLLEGCFLPPVAPLTPAASSATLVAPHSGSKQQPAAEQPLNQEGSAHGRLEACASSAPLGIGPCALAFMCRHMPLFDVPWGVKVALESAGVRACSACWYPHTF